MSRVGGGTGAGLILGFNACQTMPIPRNGRRIPFWSATPVEGRIWERDSQPVFSLFRNGVCAFISFEREKNFCLPCLSVPITLTKGKKEKRHRNSRDCKDLFNLFGRGRFLINQCKEPVILSCIDDLHCNLVPSFGEVVQRDLLYRSRLDAVL
jgi:hypothetical protein